MSALRGVTANEARDNRQREPWIEHPRRMRNHPEVQRDKQRVEKTNRPCCRGLEYRRHARGATTTRESSNGPRDEQHHEGLEGNTRQRRRQRFTRLRILLHQQCRNGFHLGTHREILVLDEFDDPNAMTMMLHESRECWAIAKHLPSHRADVGRSDAG